MSDGPIPVTVVTGFLGAGKTTLVDAWLRAHAPGELAVIVNEVGALGIDGALLGAASGERARRLVEITGGCICCATYGELVAALRDLASAAPAPRRILVETSGAASPAGVLRALVRQRGLALDGIVTVVDATRVASLEARDLAIEQVAYADVVVLSRADLAGEDALRGARRWIASRNAAVMIAPSARGVVREHGSLDALLASRHADLPRIVAPPSPSRDHGIESLALEHEGELDEDRFGDWIEGELARFEGRLLRVKGILAMRGRAERVVLQGVADQLEVALGAPWSDAPRTSRLVLVGFALDGESLRAGFAACAA